MSGMTDKLRRIQGQTSSVIHFWSHKVNIREVAKKLWISYGRKVLSVSIFFFVTPSPLVKKLFAPP